MTPYTTGKVGNAKLGFDYFGSDEFLSTDDNVSRLLFVKGTDVLADVEVHGVELTETMRDLSRPEARLAVWRDSLGVTLDDPAAAP